MSKTPWTRAHQSQGELAELCDEIASLKKELKKTDRKLEALLGTANLVNASTKEISDYVLASIVSLTGSPHGFYGFISDDESIMTIYSWSGDAMSECSTIDKPTDFSIAQAGVWAESVRKRRALILNDYSQEHPGKKGLPEGHVALERLLVLPVFRGEKIEAVVAVANRDEDYTERDVDELSAFLVNIQVIIENQRVRSEKDELERKYFQAQKMESVGRLAGGIAHDLNNMLSPVLGYAELIADDLKTGTVQPHMVEKIIGGAQRARDLVHRLLAFSRKQVMELGPVAVDEMIAGFEPLLRRVLREDIALVFDLRADNTHVVGDPGQLEQVIMNLAVNAQDAMPKGGSLTVTTSVEQSGSDQDLGFEGLKSGRFVVLTVEDTGHGMDERVLEKLFEPFFTTKDVGKGTGLGLAMVWGIVKQHGGLLSVNSEPGRGSVFKVALPAHAGVGRRRSDSIVGARPGHGTETILVVEDEELVRKLTEDMLVYQGYKVLTACGADEALEALENRRVHIDLLLTDVIMPGLAGKELYNRASEMRPALKVLYMSGYPAEVIAERGVLDAGVALLHKPFSRASLIEKVAGVLERKN